MSTATIAAPPIAIPTSSATLELDAVAVGNTVGMLREDENVAWACPMADSRTGVTGCWGDGTELAAMSGWEVVAGKGASGVAVERA